MQTALAPYPVENLIFILGGDVLLVFNYSLFYTPLSVQTGGKKKKIRKRQLSLWQNPNWNAKRYSEDNGEERC